VVAAIAFLDVCQVLLLVQVVLLVVAMAVVVVLLVVVEEVIMVVEAQEVFLEIGLEAPVVVALDTAHL
jgi:hypothetical protein